jgi:hypothetical protein
MIPLVVLIVGMGWGACPAPCCATEASYLYQPAFCIDYELRGPVEAYHPQPGDLFMCTGRERWAKWGHYGARAFAPQHSGVVVARPDGSLALLEAGPHNTMHCEVVDLIPQLASYGEIERVWIRRRCVPLTPEQSASLTAFAMSIEGRRFAFFRMLGQLTVFRCRGPLRTEFMGGPHGDERSSYYCAELTAEACVAGGMLDPVTTRPSASYPRDFFFGQSKNRYINQHLDMSEWYPPQRWTLCPGSECTFRRHYRVLDRDNRP